MSDKIREAYHAAYPISGEWLQPDGTYSHEPTQCGWDGFLAGWQAALAQQPAPVAVPAVVREAVESAFSESPGWRAKIAAAVRALPDVGDPAAPPAAEQPDTVKVPREDAQELLDALLKAQMFKMATKLRAPLAGGEA